MPNIKQRRTFISYSRANKDFALKLAKELRASGFNIWVDVLDIPTGSRWDDEVEKALESSEIFMVILTPASITSEHVKDEIGYAIDTGKHILPVLLENAKVPLRLRRFQYVDFTSKNYKEGVESAKQLLRSLTEEQTVPRREVPASTQAQNVEREKVEKASVLMRQAKQLLQNRALPEAVQVLRQILTFMPNHEEALTLLAQVEAAILQERESSSRKAQEEANRLAAQKKDEAERLARQKAEEERLAKAKAEADHKAKVEANRLAAQKKDEAERLARQKAEEEQLAGAQAEPATSSEMRSEIVAATPTRKKSIPMGLVAGIVAVVVLAIAGTAFGALSKNRSSSPSAASPAGTDSAESNVASTSIEIDQSSTEANGTSVSMGRPEMPACETPTASIKSNNAYLREGPDLRFPGSSPHKKGDQITVLGRYKDWFHVEAANGKKGWLHKNWLAFPSNLDVDVICSIPVEKLPPTPQTSQKDPRTPGSGEDCVPTYYVSCP